MSSRDIGGVCRIRVRLARAMLVVLASAAVGYAFYSVLSQVAPEGARRGPGG